MSYFELVEVTPSEVVIKVDAEGALTIAKHPYLQSTYAYINVTRGKQHIFTVIKKDGTTWDFEFGSNGSTCIGSNTKRLKEEVLKFIRNQNICLNCTFDKADSGRVFYNPNYHYWMLFICKNNEEGHIKFEELKQNTDRERDAVLKRAEKFGLHDFKKTIGTSGIEIWEAYK